MRSVGTAGVKLVELEPKWLMRDGVRVGLVFRCPCQKCTPQKFDWLSCYCVPMSNLRQQYELLKTVIPQEQLQDVVPVKRDFAWSFVGDSFETLSIAPSIDASASGNWHGHITKGAIV